MLFLGALVRKIIDYQSGYVTPGRWGLSALLVASISFITLFKHLPKAHKEGGMPFIISLSGLTYAILIGLAYGRLDSEFIVGVIEWLAPVSFGFHIFINWHNYPNYRKIISNTFVWGTLVMGAYGVFQYCVAPAWDEFYLDAIEVNSFGSATPFNIRVWGTSTSPQEFSAIMLAGTILIFSSQGIIKFAAAGTGYLSFILTMARSGWLGWLASIGMFLPSLKLQLQMRMLVTILVMALVVVPLTQIEPFTEVISQRIESLTSVEDDFSLEERSSGYQRLLNRALSEFVGLGVGGDPGIRTPLGDTDTSIFPLLFQFGWFGTIPYIGGILLIILRLFSTYHLRADAFGNAARAIALGIFSQIGLNLIFTNVFGFVLWGFLGISLAAANYYQASSNKHLH
jgi:hypothetical protein